MYLRVLYTMCEVIANNLGHNSYYVLYIIHMHRKLFYIIFEKSLLHLTMTKQTFSTGNFHLKLCNI